MIIWYRYYNNNDSNNKYDNDDNKNDNMGNNTRCDGDDNDQTLIMRITVNPLGMVIMRILMMVTSVRFNCNTDITVILSDHGYYRITVKSSTKYSSGGKVNER